MAGDAREFGLNVGEYALVRLFGPSKLAGVRFDVRDRGLIHDRPRMLSVVTDEDVRGIADSLVGKGMMAKDGDWEYEFTRLGQSVWEAIIGPDKVAAARRGGLGRGTKKRRG